MKRRSRRIAATSAAKNFGALIDHVRSERAEYIVERDGVPVVRVTAASHRCTIGDLVELFKSRKSAGEAYLKAVERGIADLNKPAVPENPWER